MVVKEFVQLSLARLTEAGIADADTDTFLFLEAVTGFTRARYLLEPERPLSEKEIAQLTEYIARRAQHEPCQYILGETEFYGLKLFVDPGVLIPRQDTEVLVEEALKRIKEESRVLDLCTGSGAVAIAIKSLRQDADVTALDISPAALEVAEKNSRRNHCDIRFLKSDLFEKIEEGERFDVIVSNPPYVSESEYETLMPEVKDHEPQLALKAGAEGLDIYRRLVKDAPAHLNSGGVLLVEIGCGQGKAVSGIFAQNGFQETIVVKDLAGLDRVVAGVHG